MSSGGVKPKWSQGSLSAELQDRVKVLFEDDEPEVQAQVVVRRGLPAAPETNYRLLTVLVDSEPPKPPTTLLDPWVTTSLDNPKAISVSMSRLVTRVLNAYTLAKCVLGVSMQARGISGKLPSLLDEDQRKRLEVVWGTRDCAILSNKFSKPVRFVDGEKPKIQSQTGAELAGYWGTTSNERTHALVYVYTSATFNASVNSGPAIVLVPRATSSALTWTTPGGQPVVYSSLEAGYVQGIMDGFVKLREVMSEFTKWDASEEEDPVGTMQKLVQMYPGMGDQLVANIRAARP